MWDVHKWCLSIIWRSNGISQSFVMTSVIELMVMWNICRCSLEYLVLEMKAKLWHLRDFLGQAPLSIYIPQNISYWVGLLGQQETICLWKWLQWGLQTENESKETLSHSRNLNSLLRCLQSQDKAGKEEENWKSFACQRKTRLEWNI